MSRTHIACSSDRCLDHLGYLGKLPYYTIVNKLHQRVFTIIIGIVLGIKYIFSISKARKIATSPLFIALSIYLFIQLQIFNLSINMADEGFFLDSAIKINLGKIPYRDFFMQVTPGNYYVLAFFLKLFGNYIIIDRVLFIAYTCLLLAVLSRLFKLKGIWSYIYLILIVFLQIGPSTFISYNSAYGIAILAFYFLTYFLLIIRHYLRSN